MYRNINNFNAEVSLAVSHSAEDTDTFTSKLIHFTIMPHVITVGDLTKFFFITARNAILFPSGRGARVVKMVRTQEKVFCVIQHNQLTPRSCVLLEKPQVAPLLKNIPTFYGTRRFITVFT
jgi:hypothetical protein